VTKVRNSRELVGLLPLVPKESIVLAPENVFAKEPTKKAIDLTRRYNCILFAGGTLVTSPKPYNVIWRVDKGEIVTAMRKCTLWKSEKRRYAKAPEWEGLQTVNSMRVCVLNCHELTTALSVPKREVKPLGEQIIAEKPDVLFCAADWEENVWYLEAGAHMLGAKARCKVAGISNKSGSAWVYVFRRGKVIKERCAQYGFIAIEPSTLDIKKVIGISGRTAVQKKLVS